MFRQLSLELDYNLLLTKRGVKGGYGLALPPESITLAQVIRALEGPIGMTDCASTPGSCEWEPRCPVKVNWQRISGAVREALDKIPLSEMVGPAGQELLRVGEPVVPR